jgi:aspartyl-tRNA(Asn)/glutamyl-tRNA(Gln) amidotransferase subunit A
LRLLRILISLRASPVEDSPRMSVHLHRLSIAQLRAKMAEGGLTAVAITDHYLARIAKFDGALGSYMAVDAAGARAAAAASDARRAQGQVGALEGIPMAIKDNIAVAGLPLTAGIGARRAVLADADAAIVAQLRAAGAIILGTLKMHEAALGATTDNPFFGRAYNPHKVGYTPGGSSGGSGAAVAAGLCVAALGTDTMGSVRIPASYCGVYGLKPSHAVVPDAGLIALAHRLDCIGPLARSLADLEMVWAAMAPPTPSRSIERIIRLDAVDAHPMEKPAWSAYTLAASLLEGSGLSVTQRALVGYDFGKTRRAGLVVAEVDAARVHADMLARDPNGFSEGFRAFLHYAAKLSPEQISGANALLDEAGARLRSLVGEGEALLMPTAPQPAFAFDDPVPADQANFTAIANVAGLPALTLPCGWTSDGLPVGVQLVGSKGSEAALLALARTLDRAANGYQFPAAYDEE